MSKENIKGDECKRSVDYSELLHAPSTLEGTQEIGEFFTRLSENVRTIEKCFSKDAEFASRLKLAELKRSKR